MGNDLGKSLIVLSPVAGAVGLGGPVPLEHLIGESAADTHDLGNSNQPIPADTWPQRSLNFRITDVRRFFGDHSTDDRLTAAINERVCIRLNFFLAGEIDVHAITPVPSMV